MTMARIAFAFLLFAVAICSTKVISVPLVGQTLSSSTSLSKTGVLSSRRDILRQVNDGRVQAVSKPEVIGVPFGGVTMTSPVPPIASSALMSDSQIGSFSVPSITSASQISQNQEQGDDRDGRNGPLASVTAAITPKLVPSSLPSQFSSPSVENDETEPSLTPSFTPRPPLGGAPEPSAVDDEADETPDMAGNGQSPSTSSSLGAVGPRPGGDTRGPRPTVDMQSSIAPAQGLAPETDEPSPEPTEVENPDNNNNNNNNDSGTSAAGGSVFEGPVTSTPDSDDGLCFHGESLVQVEGFGMMMMKDVETGMKVWTGKDGGFSEVFMWTHRVKEGIFRFLKLELENGGSITLTKDHYLYVGGVLKTAGSVQIGEEVFLGGKDVVVEKKIAVIKMKYVKKRGLYNPQTLHGDIVVDGVKASTYTKAIAPRVAKGLLKPLKVVYGLVGLDFTSGLLENGGGWFSRLMPKGSEVHEEL